MKKGSVDDRYVYIDILRVFSTFAVIVLHVASKHWYDADPSSFEWQVFNVYDGLVRWSVPVFVMISGCLFLSSHHPVKKIYGKNILRIATAFIFWSFLYAAINFAEGSSLSDCLAFFIKGPYHMWFLYMIAGLYIVTPLLYGISGSKELTLYFLALSFVFAFLIPQASRFLSLSSDYKASLLSYVSSTLGVFLPLGYTGYYLLGKHLHERSLSPRFVTIICITGCISFLLTIGLSAVSPYMIFRQKSEYFFGNMTVNVLLNSIFVFTMFKLIFEKKEYSARTRSVLKTLSDSCFCAFLVHVLLIDIFEKTGLGTLSFNPVLSVPVISCLVFIISFILSFFIRRIPVLGRYIA